MLRPGCWISSALSALLFCAPARTAAQSERADRTAVLATVQRLFDGMAAHDTVSLHAALAPDGRFFIIRVDTAGAAPAVSSVSHADFIARMGRIAVPVHERMWDPTVLIRGPIAVVWTRYDFHQNNEFSHCGTDSFTLARTAEGWRITGATFTVEPKNCETPPSGRGPG